MVLTRSQYENMTKEELIQELTDINFSFVNDINSELQQCKKFNSHLLTRIQLQRNAVTNSQYNRRETIES